MHHKMATHLGEPESCREEPPVSSNVQHKATAPDTNLIRNPYQASCCGYSFCESCIERVQSTKKPCPTCNEAEFSSFRDKRLLRSLYSLHVRCEHKKDGCQWTGELGEIARHLNVNPDADRQLTGCMFVRVQCVHCAEQIERQHIQAHQLQSCPKRPFTCVYCNDHLSSYNNVVENHWPVCMHYPVPCPNQCGQINIKRLDLEQHVFNDCPLTMVTCDFHYAGCEIKLPRKDMMRHMNENLFVHMAQLGVHSNRMAEKVIEKDKQIDGLIAEMHEKLEEHKQKIDTLERENKVLRKSLEQKITQLEEKQDTLSKQGLAIQQEIEKLRGDTQQVKKDLTGGPREYARMYNQPLHKLQLYANAGYGQAEIGYGQATGGHGQTGGGIGQTVGGYGQAGGGHGQAVGGYKQLCRVPGCSFKAVPELDNFCPDCYEEHYGTCGELPGKVIGGGATGIGTSGPKFDEQPPVRRLCRVPGCSFKAVPELDNFCPDCYDEHYSKPSKDLHQQRLF